MEPDPPPTADLLGPAAGLRQRIYPAIKFAPFVEILHEAGVTVAPLLSDVQLIEADIHDPETRVSIDQVLTFHRGVMDLTAEPGFAYRAGLRFHVTTYGMYGLAMLCSVDFRRVLRFAEQYHQLATPLAAIAFREEGARAIWRIDPLPYPDTEEPLRRFIVELQCGIHTSLIRDIMGPDFAPSAIHLAFQPPLGPCGLEEAGCKVVYGAPENAFVFDGAWLGRRPRLASAASAAQLLRLCDEQLADLRRRAGTAGRVRALLLANLAHPIGLQEAARRLNVGARTLRRQLGAEGATFSDLRDEVRSQAATKYLRDTRLTLDDIATLTGFSDAAGFSHAYRRWTARSPGEARAGFHRRPPGEVGRK
jgi:AraC-like DNA-binding protein